MLVGKGKKLEDTWKEGGDRIWARISMLYVIRHCP